MARKERIEFQRSEDFALLDGALSEAIEELDKANDRIGALLQDYKPPEQPAQDYEEAADSADDVPDESANTP